MTKREKTILVLLAMAQFILTLDSTVMNVSISTLVVDLDTTIYGVQSAITFYTLVMAASMIPGAKIGDIIGRRKAFIVGLIIYGVGSFITSISPNVQILTFGWSVLEGLGAGLIMPAMISLISGNFKDKSARIKAFSTVAAMAAIGAGVGPIIGGLLTTYATWRLAFLGEVLIVIYILLKRGAIEDVPLEGEKPTLDVVGVILNASGLVLIVEGILLSSTYGLIHARQDFSISGNVVISAGSIAPTIYFLAVGVLLMAGFVWWQVHREHSGKLPLVHLGILKHRAVSSGLGTIFSQQFLLGGVMYTLALYTQMELGYNAIQTGVTMLPLSVMILVLASRSEKYTARFSTRLIVRTGLILLVLGSIWLGLRAGSNPDWLDLAPTLALVGAGVGILASQIQNIIQSAVPPDESAEASGLTATFQNLGMSFGTAISGVFLVGILLVSSTNLINENTVLGSQEKTQLQQGFNDQARIVSDQEIQEMTASLPPEEAQAVTSINAQARENALTGVFILLGVLSSLGLLATFGLSKEKPEASQS